MAFDSLSQVFRKTLLRLQPGGAGSDSELLARFIAGQDQVAFEELVRRHGPMVLRVCQRVLRHGHDAEDAFQATFIVLARRAEAIVKRDSLGSWLHGVAHQVSLQARERLQRIAARRQAIDVEALVDRKAPGVAAADDGREIRAVLDEEIQRLPAKYRVPVVLCYLEGKSNSEAGQLQGCSTRTIERHLAQARALLEQRLARRGLAVSGAALVALLGQETALAALPTALVVGAVRAAPLSGAGSTALAGAASTEVRALSEAVLRSMVRSRLKRGVLLLAVLLVGVGLATVAFLARPGRAAAENGLILRGHEGAVHIVAWTPDNATIVTVGYDRTIRLWDPRTGQERARFPAGDSQAHEQVNGDGSRVAVPGGGPAAQFLAVSPDSKHIAWTNGGNQLRLRDMATGQVRIIDVAAYLDSARTGRTASAMAIAFSPDSKTLAVPLLVSDEHYRKIVNHSEQHLRVPVHYALHALDVATGKMRAVSAWDDLHTNVPRNARFSSDGRTVLLGTAPFGMEMKPVRQIDWLSGQIRSAALDGSSRYYCQGVSPDGRSAVLLRLPSPERPPVKLLLWDLDRDRERVALQGDVPMVQASAFSADGKYLAGSGDGRVRVWDTATGQQLASHAEGNSLLSHYTVSFSADGKTLAACRNDGTVQLWNWQRQTTR